MDFFTRVSECPDSSLAYADIQSFKLCLMLLFLISRHFLHSNSELELFSFTKLPVCASVLNQSERSKPFVQRPRSNLGKLSLWGRIQENPAGA